MHPHSICPMTDSPARLMTVDLGRKPLSKRSETSKRFNIRECSKLLTKSKTANGFSTGCDVQPMNSLWLNSGSSFQKAIFFAFSLKLIFHLYASGAINEPP